MPFEAFLPTRLVAGVDRLAEAGALASALGRRALVVTSRSAMARLGYTARLLDSLTAAGVEARVFDDLGASPSTDDVDRAAAAARELDAELIVGLGGGSALDGAKAVACVTPGRLPCADYLHDRAPIGPRTLPIVAIPTTSGTGSEMNRSAILLDPAARHRDGLRSDFLFPRVALVDPRLTCELPADVTAQTGFDALAHAVESYVSPRAQPLADALALAAIDSVVAALPVALERPGDLAARERLALAATSMGYNLSCVGTCLPHRLDKPLCALHPQLAHGQAVALFYPAWVEASWRGRPDRFARICAALDPATAAWPIERAAAACADRLRAFIAAIGLGRTAAQLGLSASEDDVVFLAERVRGNLRANPVPVEAAQVADWYRRALAGA